MAKYMRRFQDRIEDRDPNVIWMEIGESCEGYIVPRDGWYETHLFGLSVSRGPDILFQTHLLNFGARVDWGRVVLSTTVAWDALHREILNDPFLVEQFPHWDRKFEEFVAGGYRTANWRDVILTPRSGDGGFDIAAWKRGRQIFDETKAYSPNRPISNQIVRAAVGLLKIHEGLVNQVRVTTTSTFAPSIPAEIAHLMPDQLALRDLDQLLYWLGSIGTRENQH